MADTSGAGTSAAAEPAGPAASSLQPGPHRPLLSVDKTDAAPTSRHVLLPVDDTDDSQRAIEWAIAELYKPGDAFHLLHVIPEPGMVHIWAGVYVPPDENAELLEVEDTKIFVSHRFAHTLMEAKVPFRLHVIVGPTDTESVAEVIRKKCDDLQAGCIVLAKHSKGRFKEMFVGSVTVACLRKCEHVPVIVVPHN